MAKDFLPKLITWFRLDEHVRRLKTAFDALTIRVETLENASSEAFIPLTGTESGSPITGDIEFLRDSNFKNIFDGSLIGDFRRISFEDDSNILTLAASSNPNLGKISISPNGLVISSTDSTSKGIEGTEDYTANITDLSFVQKKYVDEAITDNRPYKVYTALLNQSAEVNGGNPVATVLENTIGTITWIADGTGQFYASSAALFTANKTYTNVTKREDLNNYTIYRNDASSVYVEQKLISTNTYTDNMSEVPVEIRVYN